MGEFGEGFGDPMLGIEVDAEFVVAAAQVLDERVPGADDPVQITRAERSCFSPRIGRSRDFSRP